MGWLDSLTAGSEEKAPYFTIPEPLQEYLKVPPQIQETYESFTSTQLAYAGAACGVSFLMGVRVGRIRPVWRAYRDVTEISNSAIGPDSPSLQGCPYFRWGHDSILAHAHHVLREISTQRCQDVPSGTAHSNMHH